MPSVIKKKFLYRLLENSKIYNLSQWFFGLGTPKLLPKVFEYAFSESKGLMLDVGCGPVLTTPPINGQTVGLDYNLDYLRNYPSIKATAFSQDQSSSQTYFKVVGSADVLPFKQETFDECRSAGLLHHLPNDCAIAAIKEMFRCAKKNGKVIIIDNVWPKNSFLRPFAWLIRKLDRGEWIRHEEELIRMVNTAIAGQWQYKRFTYTLHGLECLVLTTTK
jgi:SAM-dependent methyltransferase